MILEGLREYIIPPTSGEISDLQASATAAATLAGRFIGQTVGIMSGVDLSRAITTNEAINTPIGEILQSSQAGDFIRPLTLISISLISYLASMKLEYRLRDNNLIH
jgi:hypothetical protein